MNIHDKLTQIQNKIKVEKKHHNKFGNYYYRKAEDILMALKPLLKEYDCTIVIDEKIIGETMIQSTAIIGDNLGEMKARAIVGIDFEQKGQQMPQKFGTASSYAKKYALANLLGLDDSADSDALNKYEKEKPTLLANTPDFERALKALTNGYTIADIQKKYTVNTSEFNILNEEINKLSIR
tara:strand:+ start:651 stop:1193 length:543 start_codon:yes stop_codon:yes gene_type:complete